AVARWGLKRARREGRFGGPAQGAAEAQVAGYAGGGAWPRRLFRHHAGAGKQAGKPCEDHRLGCMIGGGDRGTICLGPDLERARACRKNGGCRGRDDAGELVEQPAVRSADVVVRSQGRRLLVWWI